MTQPLRSNDEPAIADPPASFAELATIFRRPVDIRSLALTGLFVLAALYTMYVARTLIEPVVAAVLLNFLLSPAVGRLGRWRVPRPVAAGVVLLALAGVVGFGIYSIWEPANEWLGESPRHLSQVEAKVREAIRPVERVGEAAAQVEKMTKVDDSAEPEVKVSNEQSLGESLLLGARSLIASAAIVVGLLYFLLATEDLFLRKLVRILPRLKDKKRAVEIARQIQSDISVHLVTITSINIVLGLCVWAVMVALGMPSPLLWGVLAAALNFVPYLGAAVGVSIVGAVSLLTFDSISYALLAPAGYAVLTVFEGTFVTPSILGRRLSLNPIVVFLGIFFWGWIWGVSGAILAVPMLLVLKTSCDNIPPLAPIGEFLGK